MSTSTKRYDVIVIGGGITGTGTARDCALRGLNTLLVERFDFTTGATGRNHGLLHSGARYAVTDQESATECIEENMILRKIASNCVEETEGLFITLPEDDIAYQETFVQSCQKAGIRADIISPDEARRIEPSVNPSLIGAVKVPDGSVDPFRLTAANVLDAQIHGATVLNYHEVIGFVTDQNRIVGVKLRNNKNGECFEAHAEITINAAGIWGAKIAQMAGVSVGMFPAKGSLLIFGHRVNNVVLNRCRKPANADILVPGDTVCVIGTTSSRVPLDEVDDMRVTADEVDLLLEEGEKLAPSLRTTRILRAYAGVRPLVAADNDPSGRSISRGIVCLDHAERDGLEGFITITGGKLMTYRLMAETATNLACKKLGVNKPCVTATTCLPGSEKKEGDTPIKKQYRGLGEQAAEGRHGTNHEKIVAKDANEAALVCECEQVSVAEVNYAIDQLNVHNLVNLRRRTRVGMGTCQGELCACRAAGIIATKDGNCSERALVDLASFINERWKGMRPVCWGESMSEIQLTATIYEGLCGLDAFANQKNFVNDEI